MKARGVLFSAVAAVFLSGNAASAEEAGSYTLGVQDRVRVFVHEWPVLTGEFVVGANGTLTLPLLGPMPVRGLTPADVAVQIGARLKEKASLSGLPDTTVDVSQYRPFYVLGGVERPGEYSFRPGMLVVNAVAIAGGIYRPPRASDWGFERDAITGRGDLRVASLRREEFNAKELRLKAEAEDKTEFPPLSSDLSPAALKYLEEEKLVFAARIDRHKNQVASITESIVLLEGEITSLQGQLAAAKKQEDSVIKELEETRALVARSLVPAPRILPIERTVAQIEREKKEIETKIMAARQQINLLRGQRNTLADERRSVALAELQTLNSQRRELEEKVETANRIISGSASLLSGSHDQGEPRGEAEYVIIRQVDGKTAEYSVKETTALRPGDIVKVYRPHDIGPARTRASSAPVDRMSIEARGK
jgi:exopolysaccharide production protein ExoF